MSTILCVGDDPAAGVMLERALGEVGHHPVMTGRIEEALAAADRQPFDLILADDRLPDASAIDLLRALQQQGQEIPVVILTEYSSVEGAVAALRHGALDYLTKPLRVEALRLAVNNALEVVRLRRQNDEYRRQVERRRLIVGRHPSLKTGLDIIAAVAPTRVSVLIEGESGTGKEMFARSIHEQSPRLARPFLTLNLAALSANVLESRLFGHERGAFPGANARFLGAFERANEGTLLLDEVSALPLDLQAKLVWAMEAQEIERVGGSSPVKVDVRILATTTRDLAAEVTAARFREDLLRNLSAVHIHAPPLRERLDDLPALVEHFAHLSATDLGVRTPVVPAETYAVLRARRWTGNVRELANAVERAVILSRTGRLTPDLFAEAVEPTRVTLARPGRPARHAWPAPEAGEGIAAATAVPGGSFDLTELERLGIRRALTATEGNRTRAARLLGISERTLRKKLNSGFLEAR